MAVLTGTQVQDVNTAIDAVQNYINTLQAALTAAANTGNSAVATTIESRYEDAQLLESKLKGLLTSNEVSSLQAAVQAINDTTNVLKQQQTQIDAAVKAVGTAASVLGDIASIAAAVAKLVGFFP
jgi:prefoldin subunit 5